MLQYIDEESCLTCSPLVVKPQFSNGSNSVSFINLSVKTNKCTDTTVYSHLHLFSISEIF